MGKMIKVIKVINFLIAVGLIILTKYSPNDAL